MGLLGDGPRLVVQDFGDGRPGLRRPMPFSRPRETTSRLEANHNGNYPVGKPNQRKRPHTDTTVPPVPASVQDIMAASMKTPPPPAGDKSTRKVKPRKKGQTVTGGKKR